MSGIAINLKNIDSDLFSGSNNTLRTALGSYYYVSSSDEGSRIALNSAAIAEYTDISEVQASEITTDSILNYVQINSALITTASSELIVPNFRIPVRIIADESKIKTDAEWVAILQGGSYGTSSYSRLVTEGAFNANSFEYEIPYSAIAARTLDASGNMSPDYRHYDIGYTYEDYYDRAQRKMANLPEKTLPNVYLDSLFEGYTESDKSTYESALVNFVSHEGTRDLEKIHLPKEKQVVNAPPPFPAKLTDVSPTSGEYYDYKLNLRSFLTGAFVQNNLSSSTTSQIEAMTSNLFYIPTHETDENIFKLIDREVAGSPIERYPLNIEVSIPVEHSEGSGTLLEIIKNNELEEEVLAYLASSYANASSIGGALSRIDYVRETTRLGPSSDDTGLLEITESESAAHQSIDIPAMFLRIASQNTAQISGDSMIVDSKKLQTAIAKNTGAAYRYGKSIAATQALTEVVETLEKRATEIGLDEPESMQGLMESLDLITPLSETETVAYSIEKVQGTPVTTGQDFRTIQQMFFLNNGSLTSHDGLNLKYYDTQVQYGKQYTYFVYAYIAIPGSSYRYSNLRASRNIGTVTSGDKIREAIGIGETTLGSGISTIEADDNCIEFFDASTGATTEQLLNLQTNLNSNNVTVTHLSTPQAEAIERHVYLGIDYQDSGVEITLPIIAFIDALQSDEDLKTMLEEKIALGLSTNPHAAIDEFYASWAEQSVQYIIQSNTGLTYEGSTVDTGTEISLVTIAPNTYATNAQISSPYKYMADFYMDYRPTYKIVRQLIATKVVATLDHPPVAPDITPYQRMDNSQIIGFYINKEAFRVTPKTEIENETKIKTGQYPTPISVADAEVRTNYLSYNNLLDSSILSKDSVSPIVSLQVYRIDKEPTSISNFDGNLVYTKDLINNSTGQNYYSNCFYEEKVQTNKKFYYLFRFVNANGITGHLPPVQVVELKDDGGYKYTEFDVIYESEFEQEAPRDISIAFKKILDIKPSINHLIYDDSDVDYEETAASQVGNLTVGAAEDLIWDKSFKFRLTSKKTGKKIDLNITYKLKDS